MTFTNKLASALEIISEANIDDIKKIIYNKTKALVGDELPAGVVLEPFYVITSGFHGTPKGYFARLRLADDTSNVRPYDLYYEGHRIGLSHGPRYGTWGDLKRGLIQHANQMLAIVVRNQRQVGRAERQRASDYPRLKQFFDNIWNHDQIGDFRLTAEDTHYPELAHEYSITWHRLMKIVIRLKPSAKVAVRAHEGQDQEGYRVITIFETNSLSPRTTKIFLNDLRNHPFEPPNRSLYHSYGPDADRKTAIAWAILRTVLVGEATPIPEASEEVVDQQTAVLAELKQVIDQWPGISIEPIASGTSFTHPLDTWRNGPGLNFWATTDFETIRGTIKPHDQNFRVTCAEPNISPETWAFEATFTELTTPGWLITQLNQHLAQRIAH